MDYQAYRTTHNLQVVQRFCEKGEKQIDLLQRPDGSRVVCRIYDHPVPAYEALVGVQCDVLPEVLRYQPISGGVLVEEEYVDGISLAELLETSLLETEQAAAVTKQICRALEVLHGKSLVHRDVKPENILVTAQGRVVLLDLDAACAKQVGGSRDTCLLGTVGYAAPEQFGFGRSDARTDLFSLGVLMNVMLTGKHPSQVLAEGQLRHVIETCVQVNVDKRFETAAALERALPETGNGHRCPNCGFVTPGGGCLYCGTPPGKRKKNRWWLAALAAVAAVAALLLGADRKPAEPMVQPNEVLTEEPEETVPVVLPAVEMAEPEPTPQPYPMELYGELPADLYEPENHMVAVQMEDETYYLNAAMWFGEHSQPHLNHHIGAVEGEENVFVFGVSFWSKTEDGGWVAVDSEKSEQLASGFDRLEMKLYALDEETGAPLETSELEGCPWPGAVGLCFPGDCQGRWFIAAEGSLQGTPVQAITLVERELRQEISFSPDMSAETAPVAQVNQWLAALPPTDAKTMVNVELPAGIIEGTIQVPSHLEEVWIQGAGEDGHWQTILRGGVSGSNISTYLRNLALEGCGSEHEVWPDGTPNWGFYGDGGGSYFRCSFSGYHTAVVCTGRLRFGGGETLFQNNRTAVRMDSATNSGGNFNLEDCIFRSNGTAVLFQNVSKGLPASYYTITGGLFEDNDMDIVNETGYAMQFPDLRFLHDGVEDPHVKNVTVE